MEKDAVSSFFIAKGPRVKEIERIDHNPHDVTSRNRYIVSHDDLDWVKPPHYRSPWYTPHSSALLKYYLDYSDRINGFIPQTINISIVGPFDEFDDPNFSNLQLNISPMLSWIDERGIYLTKVHINQLNLTYIGTKMTKLYGKIKVYGGVKLRITSPKCYHFTYPIPDGYVYELPEIYSSAQLTVPSQLSSTSELFNNNYGIPQRHGIIHASILYEHAIISYHNILYGLTDELFHMSGIPEIISRHPRCELSTPYSTSHSHRSRTYNANINFRPLIYADTKELSEDDPLRFVHPSLFDDHIDRSIQSPPIYLYLKQHLQCYNCKILNTKTKNRHFTMIYCPICRKNCVQSPHIYCSRHCLLSHRHDHYHYHESSQNEHQIVEPGDLVDTSKPIHYSNTQLPSNKSSIVNPLRVIEFSEYLRDCDYDADKNEQFEDLKVEEKINEKKSQREKYEQYLSKVESEFQHEEIFGTKFNRIEIWIGSLVCFYLVCYLILKYGEVDQETHEHDEM